MVEMISVSSENFLKEGFVKIEGSLDVGLCQKLMEDFKKLRPIDADYFKENVYMKESEYDPNKTARKTGPSIGNNLVEHVDLDFIENNQDVQKAISSVLGSGYKIINKKFVMGVPRNFIPDWILKKIEDIPSANLCQFIKPEYRDMTYFHGIDFHMDIVDHKNRIGNFITLYVYIDDVDENMSPLFVVPDSHVFGALIFPHDIKILNKNMLRFSNGEGKSKDLEFNILTGKSGSVYFWSAYTLHGTQPTYETTVPRVSLRYIIEREKSSQKLPIDKFLKEIDGNLTLESTRKYEDDPKESIHVGSVIKNDIS